MSVAERRERERGQLRQDIVTAARDLLLEEGLDGLSMRSIADRIEYSPATLYLYFKDKDELVREVVRTGFELMQDVVAQELENTGAEASAIEQYGAMGRAYARFATENPAYFRVMFELPGTAGACEQPESGTPPGQGFERTVEVVGRAVAEGRVRGADPRRMALIGWGLVHGLTALYLTGHLNEDVATVGEFHALVEEAMHSILTGWKPDGSGGEAK
jgi:AcrR family transcriptional regulator